MQQSPSIDTTIDQLTLEPKKILADDRGAVMHMVKASLSPLAIKEVYFSLVKPGITKGWKRHKIMWQRFVVPIGEILFEFLDERQNSVSFGARFQVNVSQNNYILINVPPGVWYSFKCVSDHDALVVNASNLEHNPEESETRPL